MAADQKGTGGLTVGGQATAAAVMIAVPANTIVESITTNGGGSPQYEDQMDADGLFHTRITFESGMDTATIVLVGIAFPTDAGCLGGGSTDKYYIESASEELSKGPVRTTLSLTLLHTIA